MSVLLLLKFSRCRVVQTVQSLYNLHPREYAYSLDIQGKPSRISVQPGRPDRYWKQLIRFYWWKM